MFSRIFDFKSWAFLGISLATMPVYHLLAAAASVVTIGYTLYKWIKEIKTKNDVGKSK
jgi:hypothetical protein